MDASYWKARCEAAERALHRARSRQTMTASRRLVLALLGDLKPDQGLTVNQIAARLVWTENHARDVVNGMHSIGLLDRSHERGGGPGNAVHWRLGHLVQVPE